LPRRRSEQAITLLTLLFHKSSAVADVLTLTTVPSIGGTVKETATGYKSGDTGQTDARIISGTTKDLGTTTHKSTGPAACIDVHADTARKTAEEPFRFVTVLDHLDRAR